MLKQYMLTLKEKEEERCRQRVSGYCSIGVYRKLPNMAHNCVNVSLRLENITSQVDKFSLQENKKVQTQLVKRNENSFLSRPNTGCSRPSSRGFNTSHRSTSFSSHRVSSVDQQPISDNSELVQSLHNFWQHINQFQAEGM